jgi:hypothetical protein
MACHHRYAVPLLVALLSLVKSKTQTVLLWTDGDNGSGEVLSGLKWDLDTDGIFF